MKFIISEGPCINMIFLALISILLPTTYGYTEIPKPDLDNKVKMIAQKVLPDLKPGPNCNPSLLGIISASYTWVDKSSYLPVQNGNANNASQMFNITVVIESGCKSDANPFSCTFYYGPHKSTGNIQIINKKCAEGQPSVDKDGMAMKLNNDLGPCKTFTEILRPIPLDSVILNREVLVQFNLFCDDVDPMFKACIAKLIPLYGPECSLNSLTPDCVRIEEEGCFFGDNKELAGLNEAETVKVINHLKSKLPGYKITALLAHKHDENGVTIWKIVMEVNSSLCYSELEDNQGKITLTQDSCQPVV